MPVCRKCNHVFKNQEKLPNGKIVNLQNRRFCLTCSPCGAHNTRPNLECEPVGSSIKQPLYGPRKQQITCECGRIYTYDMDRPNGNNRRRCNSCTVNWRRASVKQRARDLKGGKCERCGYSRCQDALHFHHIDESKKRFGIASAAGFRPWEEIAEELEICILVCSNCHAEIHSAETKERRGAAMWSKSKAALEATNLSQSRSDGRDRRRCLDCGTRIERPKARCQSCWRSYVRSNSLLPQDPILISDEVDAHGYEVVGRMYGVTGAAVKRRLMADGFHRPRKKYQRRSSNSGVEGVLDKHEVLGSNPS